MGWRTDQFLPPADLIEAVIDRAVQPAILEACERLSVPVVAANVDVWVGDARQSRFSRVTSGLASAETAANGEIRLRFRRTFRSARSLFFAQLKMDKGADDSGLSGLILKGEAKVIDGQHAVSTASCTTILNRSDWVDPATL